MIYYPFEDDDIETTSLIYYQTKYDVITGKFNLSTEKIVLLAALELLNDYGSDVNLARANLNTNITKFVPPMVIGQFNPEELKQNILEEYNKISMEPRSKAKANYIELLKEYPTYETQQFDAVYNMAKSGSNDDDIPENCVIGIKSEGISILDRDRNQICFYKYESLLNWGISKDQLILNLESEKTDVRKVCFFTSQTKIIQDLIETYTNLIIGKSMREIKESFAKRGKKFAHIKSGKHRIASSYGNRTYVPKGELALKFQQPPTQLPNINVETNINFNKSGGGMLYGNSTENLVDSNEPSNPPVIEQKSEEEISKVRAKPPEPSEEGNLVDEDKKEEQKLAEAPSEPVAEVVVGGDAPSEPVAEVVVGGDAPSEPENLQPRFVEEKAEAASEPENLQPRFVEEKAEEEAKKEEESKAQSFGKNPYLDIVDVKDAPKDQGTDEQPPADSPQPVAEPVAEPVIETPPEN